MIHALLDKGIDPNPQINMLRPSRSGNNGRFIDPLLSTGCTPLLRAAMANDIDVIKALLARGASPNINGMGVTAFLVAAGVGTGVWFDPSRDANMDAVELLVQSGADVNAQVTDTRSYSMRIARSLSTNEGIMALHVAVQRGNVALIRYLLAHGANPELKDKEGRRAVDLLAVAGRGAPGAVSAAAGPTGPVPVPEVTAETVREMRTLLANAGSK